MKDGTDIQNGYQNADRFIMKNQKYQFKVLIKSHSMNVIVTQETTEPKGITTKLVAFGFSRKAQEK